MGFGLIKYLEQPTFYTFALIFRSLQGGSNAAIYTTAYSVFSMMYSGQDVMQVNSYFNLTIGIGLLIGFAIGTLLYMIGGYVLPFVVFSFLFISFLPIIAKYFPNKMHDDTNVSINDILASDPIKECAVELGPLPETIIEHIDLAIVAIKKDARVNAKSIQNFDAQSESILSKDNKQLSEINKSVSLSDDPWNGINVNRDQVKSVILSKSLYQNLLTKPVIKGTFLSCAFLSILNFAPAILSKRLSELEFHEYLYGVVFAEPCVFSAFSIE